MKKITVILLGRMVRKVYPQADDKTVIFVGAFLVALLTALWGPVSEVWESYHEWKDYGLEMHHVIKSHAPAVGGAIYLFWSTAKAANLVPDWLQDVPLATESTTVIATIDPPQGS